MSTMSQATASATLIILHDDLEPDRITRTLRIFPNQQWRPGERPTTRTRDGRTIEHPREAERSGWKCFLPQALRDQLLEDQLRFWCHMLEPKRHKLQELRDQGCSIEIDCYFSSPEAEVIQLNAPLLTALAELGVDLDLNIYPDS